MPAEPPLAPDSLVVRSPAKINLFLHVTGRRDDGYHTLETGFQFLDFSDTLVFSANPDSRVVREDQHPYPLPQFDLVIQAAQALADAAGLSTPPGTTIVLRKRIPPGAGLGGGSSNAAATLIGLNRFWKLGLSNQDLMAIARKLGADVPVFVHGQACWASGTGDRFKAFSPPQHWFCLWIPKCSVSTAEVFSHPDLVRNHMPASEHDYYQGTCTNDLEPVTRLLHPEVDQAIQAMSQHGDVRMNGSGSSLYISGDTRDYCEAIKNKLPGGENIIVVEAINDLSDYRTPNFQTSKVSPSL
jgi:4-diphosphocytidyl-2-C-methyl-D-erythritol kinase